ncbi:N-acetylglucosaminyl phosphatidylinositol deacetylase [sediment metagenome]|uniref:N-acetylglucosaminyl phosphatidylinositol deacetylase n=1 Tax=sediment metagenome TaxID=749907 RepID=D9PKS5_9ZZZZ
MIVFPHADDEAMISGGFISKLSGMGTDVYWVILTKGEKGNPNGIVDENLKEIRVKEAEKAGKIYKIHNLIQKNYPDGGLESFKMELRKDISGLIKIINPELIITYDISGLYGHPDHVVASNIVTDIVRKNPKIKLWYVSYPKRILNLITLPEKMTKDKNYIQKRTYPSMKILIGINGIINKIRAVYAYKSQKASFQEGLPYKFIPLWFYITLIPYEYFYEKN